MTNPSPILPTYMDSTMMSCYRTCPRKFYNEFILGLRPSLLSIDLHAGACFSHGLETFRRSFWGEGLDVSTSLGRAYMQFDKEWGSFEPHKETAKTKENMWSAIESYVSQYPPRMDHVQPYLLEKKPSVEFSFAIPLEPAGDNVWTEAERGDCFPLHPVTKEPWIYCGRLDLVGEWQTKVAALDEKTAGKLESNWSDKWNLRSQFMGYVWALQHSGIPCETMIVRGVIITKKDIRHVEAIKQFPRFLIERWHEQLRRDLWRLTKNWQEGYFDYDLGESCVMYGHCPFMTLCTSQSPEAWYSEYEVRRWDPLNKNPAKSEVVPLISPAASVAGIGIDARTPSLLERVPA